MSIPSHKNLTIFDWPRGTGNTTAALNLAITLAGDYHRNILCVFSNYIQVQINMQYAQKIAGYRFFNVTPQSCAAKLYFARGNAIHFLYAGAEHTLKGVKFDDCIVDMHPALPDLNAIILTLPLPSTPKNVKRKLSSRP